MRKNYLTLCILLSIAIAEVAGQNIRGIVTDNGNPVVDALVILDKSEMQVITDSSGSFTFDSVSAGRHSIEISHLQYDPYVIHFQHSSAKDYVMDVVLIPVAFRLDEVTVTDLQILPRSPLTEITEEETRLYPGTFFDPARFAASFPGVQVANDQANQLSIRGLHPDLMQWHIEGLEVLNPNHLASAGTTGDRPTLNAGGVSMLSNQVLSNSSLLSMAEPGYQGNALSGIMDMNFRDGNSAQREHTAQIGLLGIEAATEGPFKKGGESSYLVNARYSTVGLLTSLGVDFGDEAIQFGDISFATKFKLGKGSLKVFGVGGFSSNKHEQLDPDKWEEDSDFKDVEYRSSGGTVGASWSQPIGSRSLVSLRAAYGTNQYERTELWPENIEAGDPATIEHAFEDGTRTKFSALAMLSVNVMKSGSLKLAVSTVMDDIAVDGFYGANVFEMNGTNTLIRPYAEFTGTIFRELDYKIGLAGAYYSLTESMEFEPGASLRWRINERNALRFAMRSTTQSLNDVFLYRTANSNPGSVFEPVRNTTFEADYSLAVGGGALQLTGFYSSLTSLPKVSSQDVMPVNDYSPLNLNLFPSVDEDLFPNGSARSFGASAGFRRNFLRSYYVNSNIAYFISDYMVQNGTPDRSTTFDSRFTIYVSGGKEWSKDKDYGLRTWGATAAYISQGGLYDGIVDAQASQDAGYTVYLPESRGRNQIGNYSRVDVRIYWRKDKAKHASTWSLDIQNLLNTENEWLATYDFLTRDVRQITQLGIIPVLSYRIDF